MNPNDTRIRTGGVYRCCHESVGAQIAKCKDVRIGDQFSCRHCKQVFRLETGAPFPTWEPKE